LKLKEAIQEIPKTALQGVKDLALGMELQSQDKDGQTFVVKVTKIEDETITVDANHPLAGETLHFSVTIENIRKAEAVEIDHGHVH
jgi:FKBP-type peptidyl-prolyl cis-trans isomerase SlyD